MRRLAVALGLLLALAGCTSDPAPSAPDPAPPTPAPHPPAPHAQDRDEQAVLDTLTSLNPCLLIDEPAGGRIQVRQPHMCIADTKDDAGIFVEFTERAAHNERSLLSRKVIAGAKVNAIRKTSDSCSMEIPVSFRYAVALSVLPRNSGAECDTMDDLAATVISRLRKPATVRHPANRPDLSKSPCVVLTGALADVGEPPQEQQDSHDLDRCFLKGGTHLEALIEPGPPDGGWGKPWAKVAGKQIYVDTHGECQWTWNEGSYSGDDDRLIVLDQSSCKPGDIPDEKVKKLVSAVIKQLERPQAPVEVTDLTYGPDEADEPAPGACVDYESDACEPHQPTPVPAGAAAASRMANVDPHVLCTATVDAVHAQVPTLRPVVDTTAKICVFVEPEHAVELRFSVAGTDMVAPMRTSPRKIDIKGFPGEYREHEKDPAMASLCVDPGQAQARDYGGLNWCVIATFRSPEHDGSILEPLMTAVVTKNLGR